MTLVLKTGSMPETSIIENLLQTIKEDLQVTRVFLRSDEAGCCHNNYLIAAVRDIGGIVGVEVAGYHFSEPQNRRDVLCDRILCPMKLAIRRYCNEGHDILTAQDTRKAGRKKCPGRKKTASVS